MPDIFDEFMDELRRRQGGQPSGTQRGPRRVGPEDPGPEDPGPEDPGSDESRPTGDGPDDRPPSRERPRRVRPTSQGPRLRMWIVILVSLFIVFLLTSGIELWTSVLWFQSVDFESVYLTRLSAGAGLFVAGLVIALVVLIGNLRLAGRLAQPPDGGGGTGAWRDFLGRLNEAAQSAGQGQYGGPGRPYRSGRENVSFDVEMPDLTPVVGWLIAGISLLVALAVGGALAASWEVILLWLNRVPFSPETATPVIDPVFTRDVSWFLFELPFLRLIQGTWNWLVIGGLLVAGARYLMAASRGADVLATPVRVHLAALAALFLLSTAFGYQLDKYELAYSNAGVAAGVAYADANARFFAYDLLTVLSGLAAAFLVGGAFTRWIWPLGATVAVWFIASFVVGRLYPEAIQRLVVDPNKLAQEERFIGNNIAMTRLAFGLTGWEERSYTGNALLTQAQVDQEQATFQNAGCGTTGRWATRWTSSRRSAAITTSGTSTWTATSSMANSGRSCCRLASWTWPATPT